MASRSFVFSTDSKGSRNLLSRDTTLLLCFSPVSKDQILQDQKLLAWKILEVSAQSEQTLGPIDYVARVGVAKTSTTEGKFVNGGVRKELKLGQETTLTKSSDSAFHWSVPIKIDTGAPDDKGLMKGINKTGQPTDLSVGLFNVDDEFEPALLFAGVPFEQSMTIELTPRLRVYATSDYKETQILRGDIEGFLGEWNLAKLPAPGEAGAPTVFSIFEDSTAGNRLTLVTKFDNVAQTEAPDTSS